MPCSCFFLPVLKLGKSWDTSPTRSCRSPVLSSLGPRCSSGHFSIGPALLMSYWGCRKPRAMMHWEMGDCHRACACCRSAPYLSLHGSHTGDSGPSVRPLRKDLRAPAASASAAPPPPPSLRDLSHQIPLDSSGRAFLAGCGDGGQGFSCVLDLGSFPSTTPAPRRDWRHGHWRHGPWATDRLSLASVSPQALCLLAV